MIRVDETDPLGDVPPAFPYREVQIERGVDAKQLFELSTEIGRGKFGVVHICKEKSTGTRLAAKFIQIVKKGDRRNIEREVHMMNVLHHSKIAQLYAAYEYDRTFCMVMELVEGGELFDRVLDEKFILTEKACAIFMRQICDAIAYIHGNNVVHLDLKPENILCLTESGNRIKIIDFGLAREYDPDNKLQVLFGTPEFVAPEVVNFEAISFATDMWSVGVIAYVLVSGLSPFAGEDDIQTMGNITIGRYDFLDEAFDTVSEEAIDFINRCLVKEQKERLTAEEALKHKWIKRKPQYYPTNRRPSITFKPILLENNNNTVDAEIDKENLKELVSKWNESPNNRYAFEQATESVISPSGESLQIRRLSADANGRRGSLARDHSQPHQTQETITGGQPVDAVRPTLAKEEPWSESHQPLSPQTTPQQPDSTLNTGSPVTPLSPTLSTADLDSDLESLKSKIKIKTSKAQIKLNELAQKPDFLSNDTIKPQTFKFLPKSISLCSDDSVFKENYTKFCDRNAAPKVPEIRESSNEASQEVTTTTTKTTTQDAPEGTKVIVTKTTRSSKTSADGTKTVTVRKTIVKQKKIIEEDSEKSKLKPPMINSNVSQEAATVKRTKFRVNQMSSRDVPVAMNSVAKRYLELNRLISTESSTLPTDDLLMKKLHKHHISSHFQQQTSSAETEAMNNLKNNTMKYRSLSVDWDAMDAVENRSMKSINSFLKRTTTTTASSAVKQIQAQIEASIHK
ncbi:death-associated protein kinase related isoform X4 [Toxorhynchites rutilus septentrionalis]|uniref:death-associated protein kinase related isoform X4 n=1 Tax=Toxorhynchites rutilus septentrionalis TaxID=329112 RepID=UPI0024798A70|nr:death-associated protein kinase related isoform X4 [Toxorhynchites rutilus septentrionalis]